jgi:hypothetical protein
VYTEAEIRALEVIQGEPTVSELAEELDFDVIEDELEPQIDSLGQELAVTHANEALLELEEQHNISTPLAERVSEITERVYRELEVLQTFDESISQSELEAAVEDDEIVRTLTNL